MLLCCWISIIGMQAQSYPEKLFLIGNVNDWNTSTSLSPTSQNNGVFTWDSVELKAAANSADSFFSFVSAVSDKESDWDNIGPRYGAKSNNETITSSSTIINSQNAWKATAGTYKIVADFTSMTLTITLLDDGNDGGDEGGGGNEGGDEGDDTLGDFYVLFENTSNWGQPCVWAWNSTQSSLTANASWPGDAMTKRDDGLWYWELPAGKELPTLIKFSNNGGAETATLSFVNGATYKGDGSFIAPPVGDLKPTGTLPVLYINVYTDANKTTLQNEIIDKDLSHKNYFSDAEYWLDVNGCQWLIDHGAENVGSETERFPLEIKARGNFTRKGYSKKPYKLKLGDKQNLLNINKAGKPSKHWAILAHADDEFGYMRNFVGFRLGEMIGLPWTPRQQPIEVVINGDYRGIYFLTESIRVGEGRVPITELKDNVSDPALISGGYLVELDNYIDDCAFSLQDASNKNQDMIPGTSSRYGDLMVTPDKPEELSSLQLRFLKEQFTKMNTLVNSNDDSELWSYMELDDAARYYVVEEIISHYEAYHGSTYLFRERGEGEKWHFSPLWDCGHAFDGLTDKFFPELSTGDGNYGNNWIGNNPNSGLRAKPKFMEKVKNSFKWFVNKPTDGSNSPYEQLVKEIDDYVAHIKDAAIQDAKRWKGVARPVQVGNDVPRDVVDNSDIEDDKERVKTHLKDKIKWLKDQWGHDVVTEEPEPDETKAAPLPEYAKPGYTPKTYDIYVVNDDNWSDVCAYIYTADGNENKAWPGVKLTFDKDVVINGVKGGAYRLTVSDEFINGLIIFNNNNNGTQYPEQGKSGMEIGDKKVFHTTGTGWSDNETISYPWSGTLPLVRITTPNGQEINYGDDGAVTNSSFEIDALGLKGVVAVDAAAAGNVTIKGRGKSAWATDIEKKPYKLKFDNKVAVLGMPQSKHWVLMPYADDAAYGLLTNYAGHELSRLIGLEWTPSMKPVEVVLNGDYIGLYFIAENVRAAADRVQIADHGDPTYSEEDDFLLEFSSSHNVDDGKEMYLSWTSDDGFENRLATSTPSLSNIKKEADAEQAEIRIKGYLEGHIETLKSAIAYAKNHPRTDSWTSVIDHEQAAKYYVVQEIMDDALSFSENFYMHHTTGSRWILGPVWDFGGAFKSEGNKTQLIHERADHKGSFIRDLYTNRHFVWYTGYVFVQFETGHSPRQDEMQFLAMTKDARAAGSLQDSFDPQIPGKFEDVNTSIDNMRASIEDAVDKDAVRWPSLAATSNENPLAQRAEVVKQNLSQAKEYLATSTADGGAGWNWKEITTGVDDIIIGSEENAAPEYYDMMGRRVANPQPGSVYIVRRGSNVTKEVAR